MLDRHPAQAGAAELSPTVDTLALAARGRAQAPVIHQLGDEVADVGVQAPGPLEEDAAGGIDGLRVAQQVLQHRQGGAVGVRPLGDLRQLLGVAEQDHVAGGGGEGEGVGERDLPGLVDEEVVELCGVLAAVVPGGAGGEVDLGIAEGSVVGDGLDQAVLGVELRLRVPRGGLLQAPEADALGRGRPPRPRPAGCGSPCGSMR